jgi:protein-tyrosine phosphatase
MNKIQLSGTCNTRFPGERQSHIIRSDELLNFNEADIELLSRYNIRTVIDLRSIAEIRIRPCLLQNIEIFDYIHISLHNNGILPPDINKVPAFYFEIADEHTAVYSVFKAIADAKSGVIYFCRSGKDRTGIVTAIILSLCGMTDEYIINDYIKSAVYLHAIIEEWSEKHPDYDKNIITPLPGHISGFLKLFCTKYKSAYNYCKIIGLSNLEINNIILKYNTI